MANSNNKNDSAAVYVGSTLKVHNPRFLLANCYGINNATFLLVNLIFIFFENKKLIFQEIPLKFSKKCWHTVQKSKKRKAVCSGLLYCLVTGGQRYMYGGIFIVNGFTSACSLKGT